VAPRRIPHFRHIPFRQIPFAIAPNVVKLY
jgi:hypothetical protein